MEYYIYIIPFVEKHDHLKYCYSYDRKPENLDHILSNTDIEDKFQSNKLCLKCAFFANLWYDQMIIEKKNFTYKIKDSKYELKEFDITIDSDFDLDPYSTMHYVSSDKVEKLLQTLSMKRVYKAKDIYAYDKTIEILEYMKDMYKKYKVRIFYEEYF